MRRKDREMSAEFAWGVVDKCEYMTVAMTDENGMPYCVPITTIHIGDCLYMHGAKEGRKVDILRKNPRVCVSCVGDTHILTDQFTTEFESAILFGTAFEVTDDAQKIEVLRELCQHHVPTNMHEFDAEIARSLSRTAIWGIKVESITGKRKKFDKDGKEMTYGRME